MEIWKYTFDLVYNEKKTNTSTELMTEHIRSVVIDYDYEKNIMPTMLMALNIDKRLKDKIVLNSKDNTFTLSIYKYKDNTRDKIKELYARHEFVYFISNDITYTKAVEYTTKSTDAEKEASRKDNFGPLTIGLMSKDLIDANHHMINFTIKNTPMMDAVFKALKHTPITMEKFVYNKEIEQLVVPPQETIVKALKFFNNIAVFYDSPYRFFMDYDSSYLLSSKGLPVQKRTEKYSTILIELIDPSWQSSSLQGMKESKERNAYWIPLMSVDSKYNINNVTDKQVNRLVAAVDAGRENCSSIISSVNSTISSLKNTVSGVNNTIKNALNDIKNGICNMNLNNNQLNESKQILDENVSAYQGEHSVLLGQLDVIMAKISSSSSSSDKDGGSSSNTQKKQECLEKLRKCREEIVNNYNCTVNAYGNNMSDLVSSYGGYRDETISISGLITSYGNTFNGVQVTNIGDNKNIMTKMISSMCGDCNKNIEKSEKIVEKADNLKEVGTQGGYYITNVEKFLSLASAFEDSGSSSDDSGDSGSNGVVEAIEEAQGTLGEVNSTMGTINGEISNTITITSNSKAYSIDISKLNEKISANVESIVKTNTDNFKSQFTSLGKTVKDIENHAKAALKSAKAIAKMKCNIGDIAALSKDLGLVKDISGLGALGVNSLDTIVDVNKGLNSDSDKPKVLRVTNDNANALKEEKAKLENNSNRFTFTKNDLDIAVFSPNKEILIKNAEGHTDQDGRYVLCSKKLIFIKEDTNYILNTIVTMKKIKESS